MNDPMTTPARDAAADVAGLTNSDRYALWQAGDHHPEVCDCAGDDWSADGEWCGGLEDTFAAVERILAARIAHVKAEAWDAALDHVWELADPVNTIVEALSSKRVNTLADIEQAKRENPYRTARQGVTR